ncbi:MAG: hypothetical protein JSV18_00475 [Candidatus Bathyarchaeota archaeon]|nr:MAG: hypothetical protein JSV18_00475 [Candidatus Bathyarchaeota archaeon]
MRRVETGEFYSGEVLLKLFQGREFKAQKYLEKTLDVVLEGIEKLGISKDEPIHVCTGYIFTKVREDLKSRGYKLTPVKVAGATQELAEREFVKSLVRLGVGDEREVAEMRSFDSFLEWVLQDLEGRERFVKTGWPSWPRLRESGEPS